MVAMRYSCGGCPSSATVQCDLVKEGEKEGKDTLKLDEVEQEIEDDVHWSEECTAAKRYSCE